MPGRRSGAPRPANHPRRRSAPDRRARHRSGCGRPRRDSVPRATGPGPGQADGCARRRRPEPPGSGHAAAHADGAQNPGGHGSRPGALREGRPRCTPGAGVVDPGPTPAIFAGHRCSPRPRGHGRVAGAAGRGPRRCRCRRRGPPHRKRPPALRYAGPDRHGYRTGSRHGTPGPSAARPGRRDRGARTQSMVRASFPVTCPVSMSLCASSA